MSNPNEQQLIQLPPNHLQQLDQVSLRYDAVVGQSVKTEDLLVPGFWAHHAVKLRPMDEIRARAEDGTWVAYLIVLDCSRTWAKVQVLSNHRFSSSDVAETQASEIELKAFKEQHKVMWRAQHKFSVVRKADSAVLVEGIEQKDDAIAWLDKHAREQVGIKPIPKPEPVTA